MHEKPVALITGAARGIGRETALVLASRGYDLALTDVLDEQLNATATQIAEQTGCVALPLAGDLTDLDFAQQTVQRTTEKFARLDLLVNNAAWREAVTMREITTESWERTIALCLTVPAFLSKWAAEVMEPAGRGVIVNISSINARGARGIAPSYVAAKGGLESLTYELASLYGPSGIRVVAIAPGAIDTDLSQDYTDASGQSVTGQLQNWSQEMIPLCRWGKPVEIAKTIAWLASDDASYISGTVITVDGGWTQNSMPYSLKTLMHPQEFPKR